MKNINKNKIIAIAFLIIISGLGMLTLGKIGSKGLLTIINKKNIVYASENSRNGLNDKGDENKDNNFKLQVAVEKIPLSDKLKGLISKVENTYNNNISRKMSFIEINGCIQNLFGKKL